MTWLVTLGTLITLAGLGGLIFCIVAVFRARRRAEDEAALKARLQRVVAWNLAALAVSAIGLMCVIMGLVLA
ncbi:MAG: hypothetical protein ACU0CI_11375 [Shimia sp.]